MGQFAIPAGLQLGSTLLGGLFGGSQPQNQFLSYPGADQFRQQLMQMFLGGRSGGGAGGLLGTLGQYAQGGGPTSALQRQSSMGIGQFLSAGNPEQRALDIALPALQQQLAGNPGQQVLDPLNTIFQRNLSQGLDQNNATAPNRFSSSAMYQGNQLRQRSLQDFNLLGSQILQQGLQQQLQAAQTLGGLSSQAGQGQFSRLMGAGQLGLAQTGQQQGSQLQALMGLLGPAIGGAFGGTISQTPSGLQQGAQMGGSMAQLYMLMQMLGGGRGMGGGGSGGTSTSGSGGGMDWNNIYQYLRGT